MLIIQDAFSHCNVFLCYQFGILCKHLFLVCDPCKLKLQRSIRDATDTQCSMSCCPSNASYIPVYVMARSRFRGGGGTYSLLTNEMVYADSNLKFMLAISI